MFLSRTVFNITYNYVIFPFLYIFNVLFLWLQIQWADACLLVYAVTDRSSFEYATEVLSALKRAPSGGSPAHGAGATAPMPLALLGNKTDLDHLRQVRIYY